MALFGTLVVTTELIESGIDSNQAESIARSIVKVQGETLRTCFKSCYAARLLRCAVLEILMYVQYIRLMPYFALYYF